MFKEKFLMADDIAWIMTDLVMCGGTLPTGSPTSQLVICLKIYMKLHENINVSLRCM